LRPILHIACARSLPNLDVIKVLVEKLGVNVNCQSKKDDGGTPLHVLAQSQYWWQTNAMEYLIKQGADIEVKDDSGCTPLHLAVSSQKKRAVEILLANGADPNCLDSDKISCLNKAGPDPEIAQLLIRHKADVSAGKRPFIFDAIERMDLAVLDLLIDMKADCNVRPTPDKMDGLGDEDGNNFVAVRRRVLAMGRDVCESPYPIHFAAQTRFNTAESRPKMIPIINSLLRGGADPLLPYNEDGVPVLHEICGSAGILEPFLDSLSINLEARDSKGRTPLLAACDSPQEWYFKGQGLVHPQPSAAELLCERGVDITVTDNEGRNVLHHLLRSSDRHMDTRLNTKPIFELFLSQPLGATLVAQKDTAGSTPLHYALQNRALWAVDMLLEKGADPKEVDPDGNTALHHLCAQFSYQSYPNSENNPLVFVLFDKFLSLGLDINARNTLGEPPIFHFFKHNWSYLDNLPRLLDAGADIKMKDSKGQGLLHVVAKKDSEPQDELGLDQIARQNPDVEIFKWLMDKGLGIDEDDEQRTPLDVAAASENAGILELFKITT
jgi:ankyrin repeat protein